MANYHLKPLITLSSLAVKEAKEKRREEGLVKATRLPTNQWRIAESALEEALHKGLDLRGLTKRAGKKRPQPEALKRAQQDKRKMSKHSA